MAIGFTQLLLSCAVASEKSAVPESVVAGQARTVSTVQCEYGKTHSCPANQVCVNFDKAKTRCIPEFQSNLITVQFPYFAKTQVVCDQGSLSPIGNSHTWWNTAYAIDLQSDRSQKDVPIYAGVAGKAIVFSQCQSENDQCGGGFGNSIKILMDDGFLVFYAHLKSVFLKTGDMVRIGDKIGIEGTTGWTGEGNRHLHLSVHSDWRPQGFEYWKQVGFVPESVPYKIAVCEAGCLRDCVVKAVDVRNLKCRRSSNSPSLLCSK